MSEQEQQPTAPPKRRRVSTVKPEDEKQPPQGAGEVIEAVAHPVSQPEPLSQTASMSKESIQPTPTPRSFDASHAQMELGVQFLLADFNNLREFNHAAQSGSDKRNDVLLALGSALAVGLGLLRQTPIDSTNFLLIALSSALGLLAISLATFRQVLRKDIGAMDYIRGMNRIRAYFAEQAPQIQPFLFLPTTHKYPSYQPLWVAGHIQITAVMNSLLAGACIAIGMLLGHHSSSLDLVSVSLGVAASLIAYVLQMRYAKRVYVQAEKLIRSVRDRTLAGSHEPLADWLDNGKKARKLNKLT